MYQRTKCVQRYLWWFCLALLTACTALNPNPEPQPSLPPQQIQGMWIHNRDIQSKQAVDQLLKQAVAGNFNTLFVQIDRPELRQVAAGESVPSAVMVYLIDRAHQHDLSVHAWFAVGPVVDINLEPGPFMSQHPDWIMLNACGTRGDWLNLAHPEAFQFMKNLAMESVRQYEMDGIHLDYIRYPGGSWGFDDFSAAAFADIYGSDLDALRQPTLPAYAYFNGNPLSIPTTAETLATFDTKRPALLLNHYGTGKVLIFNWNVLDCQVGAINEIMRRGLHRLKAGEGEVHLLDTASTNTGTPRINFYKAEAWLRNLGFEPIIVNNDEVASLPPDAVLVLNLYHIDLMLAQALANYVWQGGGLIFLDGPTPSIKDPNIQAVTGMESRERYFSGNRWLQAVDHHPLLPLGTATWNEETAQQWEEFRRDRVTQFVREIRDEMTAYNPDLVLSAAVFRTPAQSKHISQAWDEWLAAGLVDFVVPMAYVDEASDLLPLIAQWQTLPDYEHVIIPGLNVAPNGAKTSQQVLDEIALIQNSGTRGVVLFAFGQMDEDLPGILANGPFAPQ